MIDATMLMTRKALGLLRERTREDPNHPDFVRYKGKIDQLTRQRQALRTHTRSVERRGGRRRGYERDFDPNVGGGVDRDKIPDEDFAGPNRSFPIVKPGDVSDAFSSLGRAKDKSKIPQIRARIIAIAKRKGFALPDSAKGEARRR